MADIEIEIDGKTLKAAPNQTVIQVADEAGIYIPRFCYHKHLSIPANCRMCLVEVEKAPKAVPACATPVMPGMKVFTKSAKTLAAQRAVMEFLLVNHPLDCPICDQGGECELQDLSMGYGDSHSNYDECKRAKSDEDLGPLISTEMTRCILCTRCIRFGDEVAGMRELGMTYRGEHEEVTTFVNQAMRSEVSGNIIDLCPVGALTAKPYRFTARAWELTQAPSVSPHDCLGTNINVHTRNGKVMRVVSRENQDINQTWISDRDRFSYVGLNHPDRLFAPMVKMDGNWQLVEWQEAFELVASKLQTAIAELGADKFGALASPNSTVEEFYLLQRIVRGLGSPHIDHRLRSIDNADQQAMPLFPGLAGTVADIEQCDAALLIGSNLQKEQPIAALRLRRASLNGAAIAAINPVDFDFNFTVRAKEIVAPHLMVKTLESLVKSLEAGESSAIIDVIKNKQHAQIILGALTMHHPQASHIRYLANRIAALTGAKVNYFTDGANSAGGWIAGAIPHRHPGGSSINHIGLDACGMLHKPRKAYLLLNVEPAFDLANAGLAKEALKQADFVVAISQYRDPVLEEHADVILPMAAFTESAGTYINAAGEWQTVQGVASSHASARPAWKILRVLGNFLNLDGFNYESAEDVLAELKAMLAHGQFVTAASYQPTQHAEPAHSTISRIGEVPLYSVDGLVRRSQPLQEAQAIIEGEMNQVRLHPETANALGLVNGDHVKVKQHAFEVHLPVKIDARIAPHAAWIAGGVAVSCELGDLFGESQIQKG